MNKYHEKFSNKEVEEYIQVNLDKDSVHNRPAGVQIFIDPLSEYAKNITFFVLKTAQEKASFKHYDKFYIYYIIHPETQHHKSLYGFSWL